MYSKTCGYVYTCVLITSDVLSSGGYTPNYQWYTLYTSEDNTHVYWSPDVLYIYQEHSTSVIIFVQWWQMIDASVLRIRHTNESCQYNKIKEDLTYLHSADENVVVWLISFERRDRIHNSLPMSYQWLIFKFDICLQLNLQIWFEAFVYLSLLLNI